MLTKVLPEMYCKECSNEVCEYSQQSILKCPSLPLHQIQHNLLSALCSITEHQPLTSVCFTFGTLFHLTYTSLASPKRPLSLHMPTAPTKRLCRLNELSDKKQHSQPTKTPSEPTEVNRSGAQQQASTKAPLTSNPESSNVKTSHHTAHLHRWHSFAVPNSSRYCRRLPSTTLNASPPQVVPAYNRTRRHSLAVDSDNSSTAFPATLAYSKIVFHLEANLECGRHHYHLQRFNNCFFGHSIVNCLLAYCLTSLNSCISQEKALVMCERLLAYGVIENVSHRNHQEREGMVFKDGRLYRFTGRHFWEDDSSTCGSSLDSTTSTSMPSLTSSKRGPGRSGFKRVYSSFSSRKRNFMKSFRPQFSHSDSDTT